MNEIINGDFQRHHSCALRLKQELGSSIWEFGKELAIIRNGKLFLEVAPFWGAYCEEHLGISRTSADRFIRLQSEYDKPLVVDWGIKKCDLLLQVNEEQRMEIMRKYEPREIPYSEMKQMIEPLKKRKEEVVPFRAEPNVQFVNKRLSDFECLARDVLVDISRVDVKILELERLWDGFEPGQRTKVVEVFQQVKRERAK